MILTCPACDTKYVVKDDAIPPGGRQVRCASCKHSWHQEPDNAVVEAESAAVDFAGPPPDQAEQPIAETPQEAEEQGMIAGEPQPDVDMADNSAWSVPAYQPPAESEAVDHVDLASFAGGIAGTHQGSGKQARRTLPVSYQDLARREDRTGGSIGNAPGSFAWFDPCLMSVLHCGHRRSTEWRTSSESCSCAEMHELDLGRHPAPPRLPWLRPPHHLATLPRLLHPAPAAQMLAARECQQKRIRENMAQLPKDSDLFRRYVTKFSEQEDQVDALRQQITHALEEEQRLQKSLDDFLTNLNLS